MLDNIFLGNFLVDTNFTDIFCNSVLGINVFKGDAHLGSGTGFVIEYNGRKYVVTAGHVLNSGATFIYLHKGNDELNPMTQYYSNSAQFLVDASSDIGVIDVTGGQIDFQSITPIQWDTSPLAPGLLVIAIGGSLGFFTGTITMGLIAVNDWGISGNSQVVSGNLWWQHSAPIKEGNSGGPLLRIVLQENSFFTRTLKVVGVNTHGIPQAESINFAFKAEYAKAAAENLINHMRLGTVTAFQSNQRILLNDEEKNILSVAQPFACVINNQVVVSYKEDGKTIELDSQENFQSFVACVTQNKDVTYINKDRKSFKYQPPNKISDQTPPKFDKSVLKAQGSFYSTNTAKIYNQEIQDPQYQRIFQDGAKITHVNFEKVNNKTEFKDKAQDQERVIVSVKNDDQEYFVTVPSDII